MTTTPIPLTLSHKRFKSKAKKFRSRLALATSLLGLTPTFSGAETGPLASVLLGEDTASSTGLDIRGWIDSGYTLNPTAKGPFNGTVTFNDRAEELQMNQFYLVVERKVERSGDDWSLGGRVDGLYGSDAQFTMASGWDDNIVADGTSKFYKVAVPQAYLELNAPLLSGTTFKVGHFYTPIGYEVVTAPDNFFYSHAYTMQYGEPFTHFGGIASTSICDGSVTFSGGAVRGWDNMSDTADSGTSAIAGFTYTPTDTTTLAVTGITGDEGKGLNRSLYSVVLTRQLGEGVSWVIQHDNGTQEVEGKSRAKWYGVNNYLLFAVNDELSAGLRAEWFRDEDGARVVGVRSGVGGVPANYYAVSAGLNFKPASFFVLRPEVRYDWQKGRQGTARAFDEGRDKEQLTIAMDAIVKF
jgi:Putative beta-barrel porin-2, OmpL-like. bbp2